MKMLQKWLRWLDEIESHVTQMLGDRIIAREISRIVKDNERTHSPNDFVEWLFRQYSHSCALSIRRQVDADGRTGSLANFLADLQKHARSITRDWFVSAWGGCLHECHRANEAFDKWSGPENDVVDAQIVKGHHDELVQACKPVKCFVDSRIAHLDFSKPESAIRGITWGDTNEAIDLIHEKALKCRLLLRQAGGTMEPTWQYNWKQVFHHPWLDVEKNRPSGSPRGHAT